MSATTTQPLIPAAGLLAVSLTAAPAASDPPQYLVQELPPVGDLVTSSEAESINNDGLVSGTSADDTLTQRAVQWMNTSVTELDLSSEPIPSDAPGVSPEGRVAGWSLSGGTTLATVWFDGTAMHFDPLAGHIASRASDVNDNGLLVGWSIDDNGDPTAVQWDNGEPVQLAAEPSLAIAVNESNEIVGRQDTVDGRHAVLWTDDQMTMLGDLGFGIASPTDINEAGRITGAAVSAKTQKFHAVVWQGDPPVIVDLGLYQNLPTSAQGLNNVGQIVGDATINPASGERRAMLWQDGAMYNLNTLIDPGSDWTLHSARDVNDAGVIVGFGVRDGQVGQRAFKLVPLSEADFNGDGAVDVEDLLQLLGAWGPCAGCPEDITGDGTVNVMDLLDLLAAFTS